MIRIGDDRENSFDRREAMIKYNVPKFSEYFHDVQCSLYYLQEIGVSTVESTDLCDQYSSTETIRLYVRSAQKVYAHLSECAYKNTANKDI